MKLRKLPPFIVKNSMGEIVNLNDREKYAANYLQREINEKHKNSLEYEIPVTTLTTLIKRESEQKFFEVAPADYIPVVVGNGAWSSELLTFRTFDIAGSFEDGIVNTAGNHTKLAQADTGIDGVSVKVIDWAKEISWNIMELQKAAKAGSWDIITSKARARKRNWDLGVQRIAFLGAEGFNGVGGSVHGLLNQVGVSVNRTLITKKISAMDGTELKAFTRDIITAFRTNCNYTAWPTHFVIPESDYTGLATQASATFPMRTVLSLLQEAFELITMNKGFKILPLSYADKAQHEGVYGIDGDQVYALYRYEEETGRMDIPVDFQATMANSLNNFTFQNAAMGQFTGFKMYRPLEMMRFQYSV